MHMVAITHASQCLQDHFSQIYHMPKSDGPAADAIVQAIGDLVAKKP